MAAIVWALHEYIEKEEDRLWKERDAQHRQWLEQQRIELEQRFLSGADCKWTPLDGSQAVYCRINGRAFRLTKTKDSTNDVHRIVSVDDPKPLWIGTYRTRGEATKALAKVAYQPEPRW
jgi:hypothetical protein